MIEGCEFESCSWCTFYTTDATYDKVMKMHKKYNKNVNLFLQAVLLALKNCTLTKCIRFDVFNKFKTLGFFLHFFRMPHLVIYTGCASENETDKI